MDNFHNPVLNSAQPLNAVSLGFDAETAEALRRLEENGAGLRLRSALELALLEPGEGLLDRLDGAQADLCLIDFEADPEAAARAAEHLRAQRPRVALMAVARQFRPEAMLAAMRSGCGEFLTTPLAEAELRQALLRVRSRRRDQEAPRASGQILLFMGSKGGTGTTTLATQLGARLARGGGRRVLLAELKPFGGDAGLYLGLDRHAYHFFDLADNAARLDYELLQSFLARHASGLDVLPGPDSAEPARVAPAAVLHTLEFLRRHYEFLLLDCAYGLDELNLELARFCQQFYLVTVAEIAALRNAARLIQQLSGKGVPPEKIRVVLNRYARKSAIGEEQIARALKQELDRKIPNQYQQAARATGTGDAAPLSASELGRSLQAWAEQLTEAAAAPAPRRPARGLLSWFARAAAPAGARPQS